MTVHDLITVRSPQLCDPETVHAVRDALASLDTNDWVICGSDSAKDDLCNYLPHLRPSNVFVVHHAASNLFQPVGDLEVLARIRAKYGIPEGDYVLCLNRLEQRKNIAHVVRSFARLLQAEQLKDLSLVLAGTRGWDPGGILESARHSSSLGDRVIFTGFVEDQDLAALYSGATVFVYPSFYEGFGLPPLEAMQCGTPVVTSNTSSLPEVVGNAGRLLDPHDQDGLCQAILEIHRNASLRKTMSLKSIERARMFSWDECARLTINAYRLAIGS
jgi:glycosyltransferase involved in cell wall biosynthesis